MNGPRMAARRILFVSSTEALYGAEHSLLHIVKQLDPAEWQAQFLIPGAGPFERAVRDAGYPVTVLDVRGGRGTGRLAQLSTALRLARAIRRLRPHLVHLNLHFAWPIVSVACLLARVPLVVHIRNLINPDDPRGRLASYLFRHLEGVICISDAVRQRLFDSGLPGPAPRFQIHQIPDARDLAPFHHGRREQFRQELGVAPGIPLIGMVARLEPMKGQDIFLEAARLVAERLPTARFVLVGGTMETSQERFRADLERMASEQPLAGRVSLLGYRDDIPDILAGLDCFVHSSRRGAFVSVLIEAMASGVPIVASDVDGIPECVGRDGSAELITGFEAAPFAEAILSVVTDPRRAAVMGRSGQKRASRLFSAEPLARATEAVFRFHALPR